MATDGNDAQAHGAIHGATPQKRLITAMSTLMEYKKTGHIHYTQGSSRMTIVRRHLVPPFNGITIYEDCSSMVTGLYRMAGLHDPNELHFSGWGYTGTLCEHGKPVESPYHIGDLVFYGNGKPWHHVACVYSTRTSAKVFSHGHEGGPVVEPIDYRSDRGQVRRYF